MKWAGGKRQLLSDIKSVININELAGHRLYEPFVGGGAFFLDLEHDDVLINDINKELINVYLQVRDDPTQLINLLKKHRDNHSRDYYYEIRNYDRNGKIEILSNVEQAARTIYLNRVCYNGLYRVNASGQFNVPFGKYTNPEIVSENKIIYDRATRGKNYFYLAINADPGVYFITSDGFYLTTSDRDMFLVR